MSQIEIDLRAWLLAEAGITAITAQRIHYGKPPQGYGGTYIWFGRSGADWQSESVISGEPGLPYSHREYFDIEAISRALDDSLDLANEIKKLHSRHYEAFGAGNMQAVLVNDQRDDYIPNGTGGDMGRDVAALQLEIVGYKPA